MPSRQRPAVPNYRELRVDTMQGENRKKADQREEEAQEKEPAGEPGTNQGLRKPSKEEIRKTPNRTGKETEPEKRVKEKKGPSHLPEGRTDGRDERPENRVLGQSEDQRNLQVHKPRTFKARGVENHTTLKQARHQREPAREAPRGALKKAPQEKGGRRSGFRSTNAREEN